MSCESPSSYDHIFQRIVQCSSRYYSDPSSENTTKLDESLVEVNRIISSVDPTARLTLNNSSLNELLNYIPILLSSSTTTAITRSKLLRLLFNLGQYNGSLRRYMAQDLQLCGPVFDCLKMSLKEQLGPQNMIDILRTIQVLTYEKTFTLGIWTNELISFLLKELSMEEEMEWLPYSMAILCNLASRSASLSKRIRKSSSYKEFARRLTKLLQHDSRIVVVSSLVLIGFLEEKLRELIFCAQNIAQTFQCVFNVLILGDTLMTRHIAADLLKRLVVSETPSVSSTPTLSSTGKDLMNYSYFTRCLQQTADLLVRIDARTEESSKIYDLLLSLCSVPSMRSTVCLAILDSIPTETKLTTPLLSIAGTARKTFEETIDARIPLQALRLLNYLLKEAVDANRKLSIPEDRILSIIDSAVKTSIQTSDPNVISQCARIREGLRLAEGVSGNDDIRRSLLEVISAPLCSHLMETQFLSNPVVLFMAKPPSMRSPEGIPEWSMEGVSIVVEVIRVLATFKDYSKAHKVLYWSSLKDDRLIPFLAFAISRGSPSIINQSLVLYTHCAQTHEFASQNLADLVFSCSIEGASVNKGDRERERDTPNGGKERGRRSDSREDTKRLHGDDSSSISNGERSKSQLDELINALKNGLDLKNPKTSDLLAAYENKLAMIQMREQELERLVATKDASLQQSERLRIQYATSSGGRSNDSDLARIRSVVADCETLTEEKEKLEKELKISKKEMEGEIAKKEKEMAEIGTKLEWLNKDLEGEKNLTSVLRKNIDEFKTKMEKMSKATLQLQEQVANSNIENEKKKDELFKLSEERKSREKLIEEMRGKMEQDKDKNKKEIDRLEMEIEELRKRIERTEKEKDEFKGKYESIQAKMEERKRKMREEMMRLAGEDF